MNIPISAAQARRIQTRHDAIRHAQLRLDDVLQTILDGHGLGGAEVLSMDLAKSVLVVRGPNEENGTEPEPDLEPDYETASST